jgi:Tol biopolymer transport system component
MNIHGGGAAGGAVPRSFGTLPAFVCAFFLVAAFTVPSLSAQEPAPALTINEDCIAFAFGRSERIVYAVRHVFGEMSFDLERDDFWLHEPGKKDHRILNGQRLFMTGQYFSYVVRGIHWSPDGTRLAAELFTTTVLDRRGTTKDQAMTLLFDTEGREIKLPGSGSLVPDAVNPAWLGDGATLAYLVEENKTLHLFGIDAVQLTSGAGQRVFPDAHFLAVAWIAGASQALAVETDPQFSGKPRLVFLDLAKQEIRELASLDGFSGGLSVSPSGKHVAYFRDPEHFEVRTLADPPHAQALKLLMGAYDWSPDEQRILLKSAPARKSGSLQWIRLADGSPQDLFHGLAVHEISISPDGRFLGVLSPGKRTLNVYPLGSVQ